MPVIVATGLYAKDFSRVFSKLLEKTGSCYKISKYTGLDQAYLSRLKNGGKINPSIETVMKIGLAMTYLGQEVSLYDIEELFNSVGRSLFLKRQLS